MLSVLSIPEIEFRLHVGWGEKERSSPQKILVNIEIYKNENSKSWDSDDLNDTVCYASFNSFLQNALKNKQFRLIEHLTYTIFCKTKEYIGDNAKIKVQVHKPYAPVAEFAKGVKYSLKDDELNQDLFLEGESKIAHSWSRLESRS